MPALTDTFRLSNGVEIPKLGFGTWQIPDGAPAYDAVAEALRVGYRHIDTARAYGNEASVGRAIRDSGIPRDEVFVTTKLPAEVKDHDEALRSFETTMSELGLDHVDLYLVHAPWPWSDPHSDHREGNQAVWRALEEILESGRARSIGVSNFDVDDLASLLETAVTTPHVNQIRWFVGSTEDATTTYCQGSDILVEAYSPLATGRILDNPDVRAIADRYGKSVAQVCIRYCLEKGVLPLPKTTTPSRITENADVDFTLSTEDVATLDALTDTER